MERSPFVQKNDVKQTLGALLLIAWLITAGACSPFSESLRREVDTTLTFKDVQKSPERFAGRTVMWGGIIIETQNRKDGTAVIKVLETRLDSSGEPENPDVSSGRFLVRHTGFLDPAIYSRGREITVIGTIGGKEELPIGEVHYTYPVLQAKEIKLWERRRDARRFSPYPYWPRPYWEPYPWPYGPPYWW
jgi:outer membrane lipoprotein